MITHLIFDWGDTIMRDFPGMSGPMYLWPYVEWIPGAKQALIKLSDRFICCIATNADCSDTFAMKKALQRIDAEKYFNHFYSSKDLGVEKPNPIFFIKIVNKMKVSAQNCIMIGNSYEKDIIGAKLVGMKTVLFQEIKNDKNFIHADMVIYSIFDLPKAIKKLCL